MAKDTIDVTYHGPSGMLSVDGHEFVAGERQSISRELFERLKEAAHSLRAEHRMTIHEPETPPAKPPMVLIGEAGPERIKKVDASSA